jgi:hypothetical protein
VRFVAAGRRLAYNIRVGFLGGHAPPEVADGDNAFAFGAAVEGPEPRSSIVVHGLEEPSSSHSLRLQPLIS